MWTPICLAGRLPRVPAIASAHWCFVQVNCLLSVRQHWHVKNTAADGKLSACLWGWDTRPLRAAIKIKQRIMDKHGHLFLTEADGTSLLLTPGLSCHACSRGCLDVPANQPTNVSTMCHDCFSSPEGQDEKQNVAVHSDTTWSHPTSRATNIQH